MRALLLTAVLAACADPVVALNITPPADAASYDTSCVTTFEIYADGANYPADANDFTSIEVHLATPAPTFADVLAAVRGKFDVPIPSTGLSGIEIYGWNGDSGFSDDGNVVPELVFYAIDKYGSGDGFTVPLVPNQSCARAPVTIRALDVAKFLASPTHDCAAGADATGGFTMGTLTPAFYKDETFFWGGAANGSTGATGTATITAATTVGPGSCLAAAGGDTDADNDTSISCLSTGAGVCGRPGEYELGTWTNTYYANSVDSELLTKFHGVILGAVFASGTRAPIAGATVDIDPTLGQVVYVDLDTAGSAFRANGSATATTASGAFLLYTNDLVDVAVTGNGTSQTVRMGTTNSNAGVATIVL